MGPRWAVYLVLSCAPLAAACGSDSKSGPAGGSSADTNASGSGGAAANGGAGPGGSTSGGSTSGGASGSGGAAGAVTAGACMERTTNHVPGTRIQGRFVVTSEGDHSWRGWYDSERGEPCSFGGVGADGVARCWPTEALATRYYTDAACSLPLAAASTNACASEAKYVRSYVRDGDCSGTSHIHAIGAVVEMPATLYQINFDGSCISAEGTVPADEILYSLGAELPASDFATGENFVDEVTSRIRAYGVLGSDGTRSVQGFLDQETVTECRFEHAEDGTMRCFPLAGLSDSGYLADASCTNPVLNRYVSECTVTEAPTVATVPIDASCPYDYMVIERGAALTTVYSGSGAECTEALPVIYDSQEFYERGAPVSPEGFVAVDYVTVDTDPGRLKPVYGTTADGGCWFEGWYDSELDARCSFDAASDGSFRCMPASNTFLSVVDTYSDASCTQPMAIAVFNPCGNGPVPTWTRTYGAAGCESQYNVRKVEGMVASSALPPLWQKLGDTCSAYTPNTESGYLTLSAVYEPSAFIGGELTME